MRKLNKGLIWFAALVLLTSSAAWAGPAVTMTNTSGQTLVNGPYTLGWTFTAKSAITVDALGVFATAAGGLLESHDVGIWDSKGTLIAEATVASGTGESKVDQFRYHAITPVTLVAGETYNIGAVWNSNLDPMLFPGDATGFATDAQIDFVQNAYTAGGTLADPTSTAGTDPSYFGPNFDIAPVPEPATLTLLGIGIAGMAGYAWRKRKQTVA
jgi:hypothetical protein